MVLVVHFVEVVCGLESRGLSNCHFKKVLIALVWVHIREQSPAFLMELELVLLVKKVRVLREHGLHLEPIPHELVGLLNVLLRGNHWKILLVNHGLKTLVFLKVTKFSWLVLSFLNSA